MARARRETASLNPSRTATSSVLQPNTVTGDACTLFRSRVRGSYNACYFVRFGRGGGKNADDQGSGAGLRNGAEGDEVDRSTGGCGKDREEDLWVVLVTLWPTCLSNFDDSNFLLPWQGCQRVIVRHSAAVTPSQTIQRQ